MTWKNLNNYLSIGYQLGHPIASREEDDFWQLSDYFLIRKEKKFQKTRQSAESLIPRSLQEVIINSWDRHHGAPEEQAEKQEATRSRKEKENWGREVVLKHRVNSDWTR